jgi:hypothetical protein
MDFMLVTYNVTENDEPEGSEDQVKLVTADYLGLRDEWELVQNVAPVHQREEQEAREQELYFHPSTDPGEPLVMYHDTQHKLRR